MPKAYKPKANVSLRATLIGRPKQTKGLPKTFTCLVCQHVNSLSAKMDRKGSKGLLKCNVCESTFQAPVHRLSAEVDVYGRWLDAIDAADPAEAVEKKAVEAQDEANIEGDSSEEDA